MTEIHAQPSLTERRAKLVRQLEKFPEPQPGTLSRISISLAGITLNLNSLDTKVIVMLEDYFRPYLLQNASPKDTPSISIEAFRPGLEDSDLWEDVDPEFSILGATAVQRDFVARRQGRNAIAWVAPDLMDSIHNLLRWFCAPILLEHDAFLLHGAGVIRDGKGFVFFGQSGAGKSTSTSLITEADPAAIALGDDAVIVRMHPHGAVLYPAPLGCGYSSEAPKNLSAPIAGFFALEQSSLNQISRMTSSQAVAALLASAMSVRFDEAVENRFELAVKLAGTPIQKLKFSQSPDFWRMILTTDRERNKEPE